MEVVEVKEEAVQVDKVLKDVEAKKILEAKRVVVEYEKESVTLKRKLWR